MAKRRTIFEDSGPLDFAIDFLRYISPVVSKGDEQIIELADCEGNVE